ILARVARPLPARARAWGAAGTLGTDRRGAAMRIRRFVPLTAVLILAPLAASAHPQDDLEEESFAVSDAMIPMRGGVRRHTKIFTPKDRREGLPIIMNRTPYGVGKAARKFVTYLKALADEGYIFVFQDIRGKFGSEGSFVMQRPARPPGDPAALDEGTDTY